MAPVTPTPLPGAGPDATSQLLAIIQYILSAVALTGAGAWWITALVGLLGGIAYIFIRMWLQKKINDAAWQESQEIANQEITQNPQVNQDITVPEQNASDKTNTVLTPPDENDHKKPRPPEPHPEPKDDNSL